MRQSAPLVANKGQSPCRDNSKLLFWASEQGWEWLYAQFSCRQGVAALYPIHFAYLLSFPQNTTSLRYKTMCEVMVYRGIKTQNMPTVVRHTFILSPKAGLLSVADLQCHFKNLTQCYISSCHWKAYFTIYYVFQKVFLADHLPAVYDKSCCTNFSSPVLFIPSNICRTLSSHLAITAWSVPISFAAFPYAASQFFQPPLSFVLFILSISFSDLSFHFVLLIFQHTLVK